MQISVKLEASEQQADMLVCELTGVLAKIFAARDKWREFYANVGSRCILVI